MLVFSDCRQLHCPGHIFKELMKRHHFVIHGILLSDCIEHAALSVVIGCQVRRYYVLSCSFGYSYTVEMSIATYSQCFAG